MRFEDPKKGSTRLESWEHRAKGIGHTRLQV
jgi:hypothetical protein